MCCSLQCLQKFCAGHFNGAELVVKRKYIVNIQPLDLAGFDGFPDCAGIQDYSIRRSRSLIYLPVNSIGDKVSQVGLLVIVIPIQVPVGIGDFFSQSTPNFLRDPCDHLRHFRVAPGIGSRFHQAFCESAIFTGQNPYVLQIITCFGNQDVIPLQILDGLVLHLMVVSVDHDAETFGILHNFLCIDFFNGISFSKMSQTHDCGTALAFQLINLRLRQSVQFLPRCEGQAGCIFWRGNG